MELSFDQSFTGANGGVIQSATMKMLLRTKVIIGLLAVLWALAGYLAYQSLGKVTPKPPPVHQQ